MSIPCSNPSVCYHPFRQWHSLSSPPQFSCFPFVLYPGSCTNSPYAPPYVPRHVCLTPCPVYRPTGPWCQVLTLPDLALCFVLPFLPSCPVLNLVHSSACVLIGMTPRVKIIVIVIHLVNLCCVLTSIRGQTNFRHSQVWSQRELSLKKRMDSRSNARK